MRKHPMRTLSSIIAPMALVALIASMPIIATAQDLGPAMLKPDPVATSFEENTLPLDSSAVRYIAFLYSDLGLDVDKFFAPLDHINAVKIFAFDTQPGERITFNMKSESSKVMMAAYPDPKAPALKLAFKQANMPREPFRAKKLVFTNRSKEPYQLHLLVYGTYGYKYHFDWDRRLPRQGRRMKTG